MSENVKEAFTGKNAEPNLIFNNKLGARSSTTIMNSDIQRLLRYGIRKPKATYWCRKCNVPLIQEKCQACNKKGLMVTDGSMRPVFREEITETVTFEGQIDHVIFTHLSDYPQTSQPASDAASSKPS